jgi:hypothetical protein
MHDFFMCLPHVRRHRIAVDIHGCANVGVTHELLLYSYRGSNRIEPTPVSMPEDVRTDVPDSVNQITTHNLFYGSHPANQKPRNSLIFINKWRRLFAHRA